MIYFIQQGTNGPIKIGYTEKDDVQERMRSLQTACADPLTCLGTMAGDSKQEKLLHQVFHGYRIRGEWFKPDPQIIVYILGLIVGLKDIEMPIGEPTINSLKGKGLDGYLKEREIYFLSQALKESGNNVTNAAKSLGISFRSMRHRVNKYKL